MPLEQRWRKVVRDTELAPMVAQRGLGPGARLGRYQIATSLARGGMAEVWIGWRKRRSGKREIVALKTLHPHLATDAVFVRMFLDEARLLSAMSHPNVVAIRDVGTDGGHAYVALEWIDGDSLTMLLRAVEAHHATLPLSLSLRIVGECCLGLHVAHELRDVRGEPLNVVHRDVSTANILVSAAGDVKLIDFGVAKAAQRLSDTTRSGVFKGKLSYVSPEQLARRQIDRRADIWAAGVVLYRLLSGRMPFEGSPMDVLTQVRKGAAIAGLPTSTPNAVTAIVHQALARDPGDRFQNAADMRRALQYAAADLCEPVTRKSFGAFVEQHLAARLEKRRVALAEALSRPPAT